MKFDAWVRKHCDMNGYINGYDLMEDAWNAAIEESAKVVELYVGLETQAEEIRSRKS